MPCGLQGNGADNNSVSSCVKYLFPCCLWLMDNDTIAHLGVPPPFSTVIISFLDKNINNPVTVKWKQKFTNKSCWLPELWSCIFKLESEFNISLTWVSQPEQKTAKFNVLLLNEPQFQVAKPNFRYLNWKCPIPTQLGRKQTKIHIWREFQLSLTVKTTDTQKTYIISTEG